MDYAMPVAQSEREGDADWACELGRLVEAMMRNEHLAALDAEINATGDAGRRAELQHEREFSHLHLEITRAEADGNYDLADALRHRLQTEAATGS